MAQPGGCFVKNIRLGEFRYGGGRSHKFAVIGGDGVHAKCGEKFCEELANALTIYFRKSEFTEGIVHGIKKAGELLAKHFSK